MQPRGSKSLLAWTSDHAHPKSRGGYRTVPCCYQCNQIKADMTLSEWDIFMNKNPVWWDKFGVTPPKSTDHRNNWKWYKDQNLAEAASNAVYAKYPWMLRETA